jgi:predicted transglutaminase-like cysteine proteinase
LNLDLDLDFPACASVIPWLRGPEGGGFMKRRLLHAAPLLAAAALASSSAFAAAPSAAAPLLTAGPDILDTQAVPISASRFSDSLKRAREDASASPALQRLVAQARRLPRLQQMAFVQAAVTSNIRWISDATEWGQHDYWASASQTLSRRAGDAKNRAIVKLHALRALGFSNSDLFLTLARDRVGGPLTVLTVRNAGRYYVMDDTGAPPFLAEARRFEFQPVMSFGMYGAWVHVRPATPATQATGTLVAASADSSRAVRK